MRRIIKMCLARNKKGTIMDIIFVAILTFVIIIMFVAIGIAQKEAGDALEAVKPFISTSGFNESADLVIDNSNKYSNFWDYLIMLIIFGAWISLVIASFLLGNEPLFIVIFIVVVIAILIISVVFQVSARNMLDADGFALFMADYPITSFYMKYMFIFNLFFVILSGLALFLKPGGGE